jgi:exopolysaccharide biosynthesis polyprenyl glycosylphosphotransferase
MSEQDVHVLVSALEGAVVSPVNLGTSDIGIRQGGAGVVSRARARSIRGQFRFLYLAMGVGDALAVVVALLLAGQLRWGVPGLPTYLTAALVVTPFLVWTLFKGFRLYEVHQLSPAEEFRRVLQAVTVVFAVLVVLSFWAHSTVSRLWVGMSWGMAVLLTLLLRRLWRAYVANAREDGLLTYRTLIVGTGEEAVSLADVMTQGPLGFCPIGFVAVTPSDPVPQTMAVLGTIDRLREVIVDARAECVFVASTGLRPRDVAQISKVVRQEGIEVRVNANLPEVLASRLAVSSVGGVMTLTLKPVRLTGFQAVAKRTFDMVSAAIGLVIAIPLWIGVAAAIKLSDRGPVLFRQQRVGQYGRPFWLLKFRTMVPEAESMVQSLRELNEASGPLFKLRNDPRVTRVGRWLRKWSLDELPQLVNVLKGDMSLVGPRPCLPDETRGYETWHFDRFEVRPGISGLWQVSGRSDVSFDEYVRMDLFYIENWSLAYDLYILAKTVPILFSGRGAY